MWCWIYGAYEDGYLEGTVIHVSTGTLITVNEDNYIIKNGRGGITYPGKLTKVMLNRILEG